MARGAVRNFVRDTQRAGVWIPLDHSLGRRISLGPTCCPSQSLTWPSITPRISTSLPREDALLDDDGDHDSRLSSLSTPHRRHLGLIKYSAPPSNAYMMGDDT